MVDNDSKKGRISGIKGTDSSKNIEKATGISEVDSVKKADSVSGAHQVGRVNKRRTTKLITASEREALFNMIDEEAEKLFGKSALSEEHKKVVQKAVKMAVDAATIDDD